MRVFVAGATGVVGQHLVPALIAAGHEVTGTTRSPAACSPAAMAAIRQVEETVPGAVPEGKAKQELGWAPGYASWREGFLVWVREAQTA